MPFCNTLPIMPKESKAPSAMPHRSAEPYPSAHGSGQRSAAIWSTADDEKLLRARASGLNWQPIANRHFPYKTANACRKRHERLVEKRHTEDWDLAKLERLAQEYQAVRKEMWEIVANRMGERWHVVEAKVSRTVRFLVTKTQLTSPQCMEKGLKGLQTAARAAYRKERVETIPHDVQGMPEHLGDSGIELGTDTELDVGGTTGSRTTSPPSDGYAPPPDRQRLTQPAHARRQSAPPPLPLYQPPPPVQSITARRASELDAGARHAAPTLPGITALRPLPSSQGGRISIQSFLSSTEP